jgi:hypothetical protein
MFERECDMRLQMQSKLRSGKDAPAFSRDKKDQSKPKAHTIEQERSDSTIEKDNSFISSSTRSARAPLTWSGNTQRATIP